MNQIYSISIGFSSIPVELASTAFFAAGTRPMTNALEYLPKNPQAEVGQKNSQGLRSPPSSQNSPRSHLEESQAADQSDTH